MDTQQLANYGINYEKGLKSCMGDPAFYRKILSMFLQDDCFARARAAIEARDYKELFSRMHELKGVSGNAALTELYESTIPLVELLRHGEVERDEDITRLFSAVEAAYGRVCDGIAIIIAEK